MSARRGVAKRLQLGLSVLGLFALLQTAVGVIAFPEIAGWQPNHDHIYATTFVPDHPHPYDHRTEHGAAILLFDTEAPPVESTEAPTLVFTPSHDGAAGSGSVTSPAIIDPRLLLSAGAGIELLGAHGDAIAPPAAHVPVATPPPRI